MAQKLQYKFYDLDDEIKKKYKMTLTDFNNEYLDDYIRHQMRCDFLEELINRSQNSVIAVSVLNYKEQLSHILELEDILPIELRDKPQNIFDRLVFSDENDVVYKDDDYKNRYKEHYINDIISDLYYYSQVYEDIHSKYFMDNQSIEAVVGKLYNLIITNSPIKIKFDLDEIKEDIICSWSDEICYYNIITHDKIYRTQSKRDEDVEIELYLNGDIYVQLPTYEDYNEYQIFRNFIDTVNNQDNKDRLLEAYDDLDNDFYDVIEELNLMDKWDDFNENAFNKFVEKWCYENHIEYA